MARAAFRGTPSVAEAVRRRASGLELIERGLADEIDIAVEQDVSDAVAVLTDGWFVGQDRPFDR